MSYFDLLERKSDRKKSDLLEGYLVGVKALWFCYVEEKQEHKDSPVYKRIQELFGRAEKTSGDWDEDWRNVYLIEQLMAQFLPEDVIRSEKRRITEMEKLGVPTAPLLLTQWEETLKELDESIRYSKLICVYRCVIDELHWEYNKRSLDNSVRNYTARSIGRRSALVIALAVFPALLFWLDGYLNTNMVNNVYLFGLYTSASFGVLGAFFSRLMAFQRDFIKIDYQNALDGYKGKMLWLRLATGAIGAILLYYAILGGLIGGNLFPDPDKAEDIVVWLKWPSPEFAKLVVWSFVGGFSERLVPDFLGRTEAAAAKADKPN